MVVVNQWGVLRMSDRRKPMSFIATAAPDQAEVFYRDVLGLTLLERSPFALVFADGDTMLRVQIVGNLSPAQFTVHGWQVADIAREIAVLTAKGVRFSRFEGLGQDALGVWTTPDGSKIAWFQDPDGNVLSLTEFVAG